MESGSKESQKIRSLDTKAIRALVARELRLMDFEVERVYRALKAGVDFDDLTEADRERAMEVLKEIDDALKG